MSSEDTFEDTYQAVDAVVSSNFSIYTPSVSRPRGSVHPNPGSASRTHIGQSSGLSEHDALLGGSGKPAKKPFYRPRPLWYVSCVACLSSVRTHFGLCLTAVGPLIAIVREDLLWHMSVCRFASASSSRRPE